ncbi:SDR family NAD(P)-dependent oxidoreductase [Chitinophaga sp. Mgbs1]|uniref:SDR family NAD(P)-dependent oxidoreductase n=1 Tax=Chitinophaga solisilvae TaxID=1233460 RepID=A0A433WD30_9BACT|nr:SDR family NAD(P)-dependent oxidoreductase [Chitinophaga solisilvae]
MKTSNNTVLITGGSAGIGLELARTLQQQGNTVIITGRDTGRLEQAAAAIPGIITIACDVTLHTDVKRLLRILEQEYPQLNILINNAGKAYTYRLSDRADAMEKAADEMLTNYFSVIQLTEMLLPLLGRQPEAAIVQVSSIVAFAPSANIPTYAASKAALHSYTQSLRLSVAPIRVFELMPPLVNTAFSRDIGGSNGIPPQQVAAEFLAALAADVYEIHVGNTAQFYQLHLTSPETALQTMNAGRA